MTFPSKVAGTILNRDDVRERFWEECPVFYSFQVFVPETGVHYMGGPIRLDVLDTYLRDIKAHNPPGPMKPFFVLFRVKPKGLMAEEARFWSDYRQRNEETRLWEARHKPAQPSAPERDVPFDPGKMTPF